MSTDHAWTERQPRNIVRERRKVGRPRIVDWEETCQVTVCLPMSIYKRVCLMAKEERHDSLSRVIREALTQIVRLHDGDADY